MEAADIELSSLNGNPDFYVRAKEALEAGELNQTLEDELDRAMEEEDELLEQAEIEGVLFEEDVAVQQQLRTNITPTEFTEFAIRIPAVGAESRFSFEGRRYLREPYNTAARRVLLKCSRQTEKSTLIGNKSLAYCGINYGFKVLYVSATATQAQVFSVDRLKEPVEISPELSYLIDSRLSQNVLFKQFKNRSQIRVRYAFLNADRVRGISSDMICYDRGVSVLTKKGWKSIYKLTLDDLVADVNDNGLVEWNKPTQVFSKKHTGEMVTFNHSGLSLRVTGDHNMWINYRVKTSAAYKTPDKWEFEAASELARTKRMGFKMTCAADWRGSEGRLKKFPSWGAIQHVSNKYGSTGNVRLNTYPGLEIPYDAFAALTGWYLAEGCIQRGVGGSPSRRAVIAQNVGEDLDHIVDTVKRCGLTCNILRGSGENGRKVVVNSQILGEYFEQLGGSYDKYIPREFFDYPDILESLLYGLFRGDACYHKGERWDEGTLRTRSKRLAEDAQEAWLRLKRPAVIHTRWAKPVALNGVNADKDVDALPMYEVCAYKRDYSIFWQSEFESKNRVVVEQVVDEEVYCFTVPNHRPIVKGRFGSKPVISGQCIDEVQDIIHTNIPVIEQCASHSNWKLFCYSGTPKSLENTLEIYWSENSTQNEWVIPCEACGGTRPDSWHWNILGTKNIGKYGPVCAKCSRPLNPMHPRAQWASLQPVTQDNSARVVFEGYRINQLMVPWIVGDPESWHDSILYPYENYETAKFNNETLGLSYDSGQRPLTHHQVEACCQPNISMTKVIEYSRKCLGGVAAGLDHGSGESDSFSVLSLGGYLGGAFQIFYVHRFVGEDLNPQLQLLKIASLLKEVNFKVLGADYGGGFDRNDWLMRNFGVNKVMKYQYAGSPKKKVKWEPQLGRFMLHRTEVMSDIFNAIRQRKIWFPNYEEFRTPYANDMLNIFSEYNNQIHMTQYKVSKGKSDDSFHSILYCFLASMFIKPRPDILVPTSAGHVEFTN